MDAMKRMTTLPVSFAMPPSGGLSGQNSKILPKIGSTTSKQAERSSAAHGLTTCPASPSSSLLGLPCHCCIEGMTAASLQLSLRSSMMPPDSAPSDTIQACQAGSVTFARPKVSSLSQPRPGGEGLPGVKCIICSLDMVDTHPQRR